MKLMLVLGGHRPLLFFTASFEGALKVKLLIVVFFSPKPSHAWYQIEGLDEKNKIMIG